MEVIISHVAADFDALASMVAASKLYPRAVMYFASSPTYNVREFLNLYKDYFNVEYPKKIKKLDITKMIVTDTSIPDRLGEFKEFFTNPQVEVHIYDHHSPTAESVEGDENNIKHYGSTVTILVKKIREKKIPITPLEATLFALGIYEETGSLTFSYTTKEDIDTVSYLLTRKANLKIISDYIHHSLDNIQMKLLNTLLNNAKIKTFKGYKVLTACAKANEFVEEMSMVVHRMVDIEAVDIVFALVKMKDRVFIIGRSKQPEIDISEILSKMGGGGHPAAASAVVKKTTIDKCEKELLKIVEKHLKPHITAKDIMTSPVRYIDLDEDKIILDAQKSLLKFGHSALIILKNKKLAGILTRHDIDKSIHHGLGSAKIEDYMLKVVITADPSTPLNKLQKLMAEHDIGRIPIVKEGRVVGIVTRNDILTALHGISFKKPSEGYSNIAHLELLPPDMRQILKKCTSIADKLGVNIFLIGGFVRDIILNIGNLDLDLVVEGDGILFASELAKSTKSKIITHEKFKTAIVFTKHCKVDIASTRVEFYTRPAALPVVWGSTIKQDLYRRDFTINALAVQLNKDGFGKIIDYFGGQRDLKDGIIRVLHNLSFIEDPTRIFRAVRFEQRYHFKMDNNTENLLIKALHSNIFNEITNERIREEIILILSEEKPLPALKRMSHLNILKVIHKNICLNEKIINSLQEATILIIEYKKLITRKKALKWVIYFMILLSQLKSPEIEEISLKFKLPLETAKKIQMDKSRAAYLIKRLSQKEIKKSEVYRLLNYLSTEALIYLMVRSNIRTVKQKIEMHLNLLNNIKFIVTGNDLTKWGYEPGPFYKEALAAIEDAQINGIIKTKEEAREYLKGIGHGE